MFRVGDRVEVKAVRQENDNGEYYPYECTFGHEGSIVEVIDEWICVFVDKPLIWPPGCNPQWCWEEDIVLLPECMKWDTDPKEWSK